MDFPGFVDALHPTCDMQRMPSTSYGFVFSPATSKRAWYSIYHCKYFIYDILFFKSCIRYSTETRAAE